MRLTAPLLLLAVWTVLCSGCNTINGMGRDLEAAGEAIQRKSR
jgi:predicted small secreted protein